MSTNNWTVDQRQLANAWQRTLPTLLNESDQAEVGADEGDDQSLLVHIRTAGHSEYTFDFRVTYVDTREIRVDLLDVEKGGESVDERTEIIQQLVEDYRRHMHECAQALHELTHA